MIKRADKTQATSNGQIAESNAGAKNNTIGDKPHLTYQKRAEMLDAMRIKAQISPQTLQLSVHSSRGAFEVLQKNASKCEEMDLQAIELQHEGILEAPSPSEVEALRNPVPPSLHLEPPVGSAHADRIDCVVALDEPEPTGNSRMLLLAAFKVLQLCKIAYEQTGIEGSKKIYQMSLPAAQLLAGGAKLFEASHEVDCVLVIESSAIKQIALHQGGRALLDLQFASAPDVDEALLKSLRRVGDGSPRTFANHKIIMHALCRWAQAQRDGGAFRPLLKDMLMRSGPANTDPDMQDFALFFAASAGNVKEGNRKIDVYTAINSFRSNETYNSLTIDPGNLQWVDLYVQDYRWFIRKDKAAVKNTLRDIARWLAKNENGLTLQKICDPKKSVHDYKETVARMMRARVGSKKDLMNALIQLRQFAESSRLGDHSDAEDA